MALSNPALCYHCGLPAMDNINAFIGEREQAFCCIGCKAVAQMIDAKGLADFYQFRDTTNAKPQTESDDFSAFDLEAVQQDFVTDAAGGKRCAQLFLPDIRCAACVWLIEKTLQSVAGLEQIRVNASSQSASITYDSKQLALSEVFKTLAAIGYQPQPLLAKHQQEQWQQDKKQDLLRLGVAGMGMMQAGMVAIALHAGGIQGIESQWQHLLRYVSLLFTLPIILYSASPFFVNAYKALKLRHLNMDVPVAIALLLAFCASAWATYSNSGHVYFDSVAMFTFFLLLGRFLEKRARLQNLQARFRRMQLLPLVVEVMQQGARKAVPLKQLQVGQTIWVAPGAVVPCDGEIIEGTSELDEAILTGESAPVLKRPGDIVIAGAHNGSTALCVRVTAVGASTQLAAIERLVNEAQLQRPKRVAFADAIAAYFVAAVLIVALVVGGFWLWWDASKALWVVLSVLVVTCPCALSLATPAALTAAINRLRDAGVLLSSANALEMLNTIDTVVFDKTGTLTKGQLEIAEVKLLGDISEQRVLSIAAALEAGSSHPIAKAFRHITTELQVSQRESQLGAGISANIEGQVYRFGLPHYVMPGVSVEFPGQGLWLLLAGNNQPLAWIKLIDQVRDEAALLVQQLQASGRSSYIMSGDRQQNVDQIAGLVGIDNALGNLPPASKLKQLNALQQQNHQVLMVGDGINDVPVLAQANVSAAMGSATEFAQNKADCILVNDNLTGITQLFNIAARTRSVIRQNIFWAIFYNVTALPLAAMGLVPPWAAAIGMSLSSLVVVLNALRLSR